MYSSPTVYSGLREVFLEVSQGRYKSQSLGPACFEYFWNRELAGKIWRISPNRAKNRVESYIIPEEISRVRKKLETKNNVSIRFGYQKTGHGIKGERGDFCLIAGVIRKTELTLFYRSLEIIGGLHYDQCIILMVEKMLNLKFKKISVMCRDSHIFALRGNSNQKLFSQLMEIYNG